MKFELARAGLLAGVVDAVKDLVEDLVFDVSEGGLSFQSMDSSHVALISFALPAAAFAAFDAGDGASFGAHTGALAKVLRCVAPDASLVAELTENGDVLAISSSAVNGRAVSAEIKLMNVESESFAMPAFEADAEIEMPSNEFKTVTRDLASIGDTTTIEASASGATFATAGDVGKLSLHLTGGDEGAAIVRTRRAVSEEFALKYLISFSKGASLSKTAKIGITGEMPMSVEFAFGDGDDGALAFYLAPKIRDGYDPDDAIDE